MRRFGILGHKVAYSLSPRMHNAAFKFLGMDAVYEVFDVEPQGLEDFFEVEVLKKNNISGLNVTIPHKEAVRKFLSDESPEAKEIGAVNTIAVKDGKLVGYNTDCAGFTLALLRDIGFDAKGKTAFMFGAGGAARACSWALLRNLKSRRIFLADIDGKKASGLAEYLLGIAGMDSEVLVASGGKAVSDAIKKSDIVINATPQGMKEEDAPLFDYSILQKHQFVFDLIYSGETALLKAAKEKGLKASGGLGMLLYQAAESFKIWTGVEAPIDVMREALS